MNTLEKQIAQNNKVITIEVNEFENELTNYQIVFCYDVFGNNETITQTWASDADDPSLYSIVTLVVDHNNNDKQSIFVSRLVSPEHAEYTVKNGFPINPIGMSHTRIA